jgi:hypothetical protein
MSRPGAEGGKKRLEGGGGSVRGAGRSQIKWSAGSFVTRSIIRSLPSIPRDRLPGSRVPPSAPEHPRMGAEGKALARGEGWAWAPGAATPGTRGLPKRSSEPPFRAAGINRFLSDDATSARPSFVLRSLGVADAGPPHLSRRRIGN